MDPIHSPASSISSPSSQDIEQRQQFADYKEKERTSSTSNSAKGNSSFSIDFILSNAAREQDQQSSLEVGKRQMQEQKSDKMQQNALLDQLNIMNMNQQQAQLMAQLRNISAAQPQTQTSLTQQPAPTGSASYQNALAQLLQQISISNRSENVQEMLRVQQANSYFMACMLLHQYQQQQQQQQANLIAGQHATKMASAANQQQQRANQSPADSLALLARLTNSTVATNWQPNTSNSNYVPYEESIQTADKIRSLGAQRFPTTSPGRPPYALPARSRAQHQFEVQPAPVFAPPPLCLKSEGSCNSDCPPPLPLPSNLQHFPKSQLQEHLPSGSTNSIAQVRQQLWNCPRIGKASASFSSRMSQLSSCRPNRNTSRTGEKLDNLKPPQSYIGLIAMCILSDRERRMVLNDIYQYILDHYPYYRNRGPGWRNSVRHNLSLNECFQKAGRAANGKGHYWTIHPANMEDFMNGDFRRRRAQRKVRRYNNMDVPSDESDDESTEDATRPALPEHFKQSIAMHKQLEIEARMALMQDHNVQQQLADAANKQRQDMMARAAAMAAMVAVDHPRATAVKNLSPVSRPLAIPAPPRALLALPAPPTAPLPVEPGSLFNGNQ